MVLQRLALGMPSRVAENAFLLFQHSVQLCYPRPRKPTHHARAPSLPLTLLHAASSVGTCSGHAVPQKSQGIPWVCGVAGESPLLDEDEG